MKIVHRFIDSVFLPHCLICSNLTDQMGNLCSLCWHKIDFITQPACIICNFPFAYSSYLELKCLACLKNPPDYERAYSLFIYNEASSKLIQRFKYNDKTYLGKYLANWLYQLTKAILNEADYLVPIPIHKQRLFTRLYNQAAILAYYLAKLSKVKVIYDCLLKTKNTLTQISLTKKQRLINLAGSIQFNRLYQQDIYNKNIVIIDDVMTTGATIDQAVKALGFAKPNKIWIITVARTVLL